MKQLGAYEAKTHLSRLLDEVERGASYAITKHGRPVAHLVPATPDSDTPSVGQSIDGLRRFRRGRMLRPVSLRDLISDGRRR
jgi:prevent-host-death family protein